MTTTVDGQDRVLATAQQIVKSLNMDTEATEDMIMILSRFDNRLSNITDLIDGGGGIKFDDRFEDAERIILERDFGAAEETPEDASEYLSAVDLIVRLTENLTVEPEVMDRAENALQLAMVKLEDDFRHALIHNTVGLDADRLYGSVRSVSRSFRSTDGEIEDELERCEDDDLEGSSSLHHERGASLGGDFCVDLIRPEAVDELKDIAGLMIRSGYEKECCQVYIGVRRDVLDECLMILGVERLSIEDVQRIEWTVLDEKLKKWILAVKVVVRVLLFGEKRLCEEIFDQSELIQDTCFVETTKGCVMQLLNFGEAVAISKRSSEKLFRILDMYEVVGDALHDLEALFCYESGEMVCTEAKGVLSGLGMAGSGTFVEFENAVKAENSGAVQNGGIHPITRYVMNYLKLLVAYSDTMNMLLPKNDHDLISVENDDDIARLSPMAYRVEELIASLQANLDEKSRSLEDSALRNIFMMNNVLYIVQKVKESEVRNLLGDQWIRKHRGKIRQWHTSYLRAAWGKTLQCLKDEGVGGSSTGASKVILKERFKNFNACFEEIYRVQTLWKVPDEQLKEELRISISEKVLPAYRAFLGRFGGRLEGGRHGGRYIKYYPDDLENYLSDLFEGKFVVMNLMKRKSI